MLFSLVTALGFLASVSAHAIDRRQTTVVTGCTNPKSAALTFDDGPNQYNADIVKTLNAAGVKGTFFFNGNLYNCIYGTQWAPFVKAAYDSGHQVASHTWSHPYLTQISNNDILSQLSRTEDAIQKITGAKVAFTRPPYGSYNSNVQSIAASRNQTLVTWDLDAEDWNGLSASATEAKYDARIRSGGSLLALNHETYASTAHDVLPYVINKLKAAGYKIVTVAECVGRQPYQSTGSPATRDSSWVC